MNTNNLSINELVDIRDVHVNPDNTLKERMHSYINQIKNPYCFKYKNVIITVDFVGNESIEDRIIEFLRNKKVV